MERRVSPRSQRILIADDSEDIRDLWRIWLTIWGFEVEEAENGAEAVRKTIASHPDLVLMDMWMPVMDGYHATRLIKENATTADVPVLALSAHAVSPGPENAMAAGCEMFLSKPVEPDVLLEEIRHALGARHRLQP